METPLENPYEGIFYISISDSFQVIVSRKRNGRRQTGELGVYKTLGTAMWRRDQFMQNPTELGGHIEYR